MKKPRLATCSTFTLRLAIVWATLNGLAQPPSLPMADFQDQLLAEVNRVRTQPRASADWLAARRLVYQNDHTLALPAQPLLQTQEGVSALDEAVRVFRAVSEPRPRRAALSRLGLGRRPPEVTAPVSRRNNGRLNVPAVAAESRPASPPGLRTNRRVQLGQ